MKFRTDFVTNSSDSSFLTFNVKNKALFECLSNLGIKIENTKDGELSNGMRIVLPSGESAEINCDENYSLPYVDNCSSISAWIMGLLLWEVEDCFPAKEADEYSEFSKELISLLNDADITHLDWEAVECWSRDRMMEDLSSAFDQMDGNIEDAEIEHTYGFEGEVGPCIYTEVHNGQRMRVRYSNEEEIEKEDAEGLKFVVTGKLKYFENREAIVEAIEEMGGSVSDTISKNTDYLICNDVKSASSEMEKAKSLGISVLTELAFIRRFCDADEFDVKDEDEIGEDAWEMTYEGDVLGFVVENGTQPIIMEVWRDGKWQQGVSEQKAASKNAELSAKREEAKTITAKLFNGENSSMLRKLLLNKQRNCLSTEDKNYLQGAVSPFDDLCSRGSLRFELGPIEAQEETDCFIAVEKEEIKGFLGHPQMMLSFATICKHDICDLDGYKNRALEISSLIIDSINGKDLDGSGKIHYMACSSGTISNTYACYTLMFKIGEEAFTNEEEDRNPIKGYDINNGVIIRELLKDPSLKVAMGIESIPDEMVYSDDYIRLSEVLAPNAEAPRKSWLNLEWEFSMETSLYVVPVCTDKKTLEKISTIVKERLSGLVLPTEKTLSYSANYKEDKKLSGNLYCSIISFG